MKVLAVLGSPKKKGNSSILARTFLEKAASLGAETKTFFLEGMDYGGCKACGACKTKKDHCVINDDLSELLNEMHKADVVVYATPNYFADVSGQFKLFWDRTYSLLTPEFMTGANKCRLPKGKQAVFIFTQGAPESAFKEVPEKYAELSGYFGFAGFNAIRGCDLFESGEVKNRPELLMRAEKIAEQLMAS